MLMQREDGQYYDWPHSISALGIGRQTDRWRERRINRRMERLDGATMKRLDGLVLC